MNYKKDIDVLAVDGIDVDWLLKMPKLPSFDEKLPAEWLGQFPGGPVGNFACIAAHFGMKVSALCKLGDDDGGTILLEDFKNYGIDTSFIQIDPSMTTPFVIVIVDPSGEKAVVVPDFFQGNQSEINEEAIARSKFVYLFANNLEKIKSIAMIAQRYGTKIMVDIEPSLSLSDEAFYNLLSLCSIASFNEQGYESMLNRSVNVDEVRQLLQFGPDVVIVTRGHKGVVAADEFQACTLPAYKVDVKDTTGAGDAFNAAFLFSHLAGHDLQSSLQFANATAAVLIQSVGTRTKLPTVITVDEFIKEHINKEI